MRCFSHVKKFDKSFSHGHAGCKFFFLILIFEFQKTVILENAEYLHKIMITKHLNTQHMNISCFNIIKRFNNLKNMKTFKIKFGLI